MADGFPWKNLFRLPEQEVRTKESLPPPPDGMKWVLGEGSKEWKLGAIEELSVPASPSLSSLSPPSPSNKQLLPTPVSPEPRYKSKPKVEFFSPAPPCVDRLPPRGESSQSRNSEDDWEFLSDRQSTASIRRVASGSVRSIASMESHSNNTSLNNNSTTLSIPFKIQRTASSSTIDSSDGALGPSGKGVLGVDYVEHVILPTDTLQGICLEYKVSSTKLRQANHFSGNSLLLAPKKLVIPISKTALRSGFIRVQDTACKEYKLHAFLAEFADFGVAEAKAYLELADWELKDAMRSARDDIEWERDMDGCSLRSGEIRITPKLRDGVPCGFATVGAGIMKKKKPQVTKDVPAIATKTVRAQDVYLAAPQHSNFGVELQPVATSKKIG